MKIAIVTSVILMLPVLAAFAQEMRLPGSQPKILTVFFSKTDNTRIVADQIHSRVGGDMFHVITKNPYPQDYRETTRVARIEQDRNQRPELAATIPVETMRQYDVIFIGYPSWWGTIPMAMFTFLEQYDLSGKTIIPFCTHEGSGLGRGPADIANLAPGATLLRGFAVRGGSVNGAGNDVASWLRQLGFEG